jgi:hypothetical protein
MELSVILNNDLIRLHYHSYLLARCHMKKYQFIFFITLGLFFLVMNSVSSSELGIPLLGAIISFLLASESFRRRK